MNLSAKIKVVAFDLDGTINYGDSLIDGADYAVNIARKLGFKVIFLTNNSTKSREELLNRLTHIGIECGIDDIYSSSYGAALYAKKHGLRNIYVSGSKGLLHEFELLGIPVLNNPNATCMVIGYNPEFTYDTLAECVATAIHTKILIACNKERTYPGKDGKIMPGCGAMVSAIEWCANRSADIIIGKPDTGLIDLILQKYQIKSDELLVVGDTYESDIIMANRAKCPSILISQKEHADTKCIKSIKEIYDILMELSQ